MIMDSIRPLKNYDGGIVPQAVLNGTLGTVVYASNYNDLDNKPSINSVELRGNKTAEELGLATPSDITVTSVNNQTGDVSLTGQNIPYDNASSVSEKINDLESQITGSGVTSVNGKTGVVNLTGTDINYSAGVSLNAKIDAVEGEIPVVDYPVTSVNNKTGAVNLTGRDIEYSAGVSINTQLDNVADDLAGLTGEDIPMSGTDSTPIATAVGDLSTLTTSDKSSLVGAVNEVNSGKADKTESITFTAKSGVTPIHLSATKTDKLVTLSGEIRFSGSANSWTDLGTIPYPPTVSQISVPAVNTANGNLMGILQVYGLGVVRIYLTSAVSNGACGFTISFMTNA
jgi:hypothetical protein